MATCKGCEYYLELIGEKPYIMQCTEGWMLTAGRCTTLIPCGIHFKQKETDMNKKQLIEKLKDKKLSQPYGVLLAQERQILDEVGPHNCFFLSDYGIWSTIRPNTPFRASLAYILKPGYEPKYDNRPVALSSDTGLLEVSSVSLHSVVSWPDFDGFFTTYSNYENRIALPDIATRIREGHKVYARFVKE